MIIYHIEGVFEGTDEQLDDNFSLYPDAIYDFAHEMNARVKIVRVPDDYYENEENITLRALQLHLQRRMNSEKAN